MPRVCIKVDNEVYDLLDRAILPVRSHIRQSGGRGRGKEYGASNILAVLVERVMREHPELLQLAVDSELRKYDLPPSDPGGVPCVS